MTEKIKVKREELKALSNGFKMLVKSGAIANINSGLAQYYAEQGHTTLKSFKRWKEEGFQVKKGEKALLLWGEPKPINKETEAPKLEGEQDETFFPLAFVFSNLQVKPME